MSSEKLDDLELFEFVKTFVQSGDLMYKDLVLKDETTTAKFLKGGTTLVASTVGGLVAGAQGTRAGTSASKGINSLVGELGKSGQENDRLALQHAVNPNGESKDFQPKFRKTMIKSALEICQSYEMQLNRVRRKVKKNQLSAGFVTDSGKKLYNFLRGKKLPESGERSQIQGIQKLAIFAASCCVSHLIDKQKVDSPHRSVTDAGFLKKVKSWYSQMMVDGIRVQWPGAYGEEKMTAGTFFTMPTPAFPREITEIYIGTDGSGSTKLKKKREQVRRPFDCEWDSNLFSSGSGPLLVPVSVWVGQFLVDPTEFIWKDQTGKVDEMYNKLLDDSTFDQPQTILRYMESVKKTVEEMASGVERIDRVTEATASGVERIEQIVNQIKNNQSGASTDPVWFNVDHPTVSFQGREQFLSDLHTLIQKPGVTVLSQLKIISGLGGIGKTETARKYIQEHKDEYDNVIWVNAETRMSMQDSFSKLALKLRIIDLTDKNTGKEKEIGDMVHECYQKLCQRRTLVIFDNAQYHEDRSLKDDNGIKDFLPMYLPPNLKTPFVLVTSRNQDWVSLTDNHGVSLDVLDDDECVQFILKELKLKLDGENGENRTDASSLGRLLGGLPLALQQAIAYIREQSRVRKFVGHFTISDYLKAFEETKKKLLGYIPRDARSEQTVLTTWTVTLSHIEKVDNGDLAINLSQVLALLSPDGVPTEFLFRLKVGSDENELSEALSLLNRYSLVTSSDDGKQVSMHRLVQDIIVEKLKEEERVENLLHSLLEPCKVILESVGLSYYQSSFIMTNLLSVVEKFKLILPKNEYLLFQRDLATKYGDMGQYETSEVLLKEVLDKQTQIVDADDPGILRTKHYIARLLEDQGKYEDAMTMYRIVHENYLKIFGPEYPDLLTTMHSMATILDSQGKYEESMELYKKVYDIRLKIGGPEHPDLLTTLGNMALVVRHQGKYDESMELYKNAYEVGLRILGPEHPELLNIMNHMAMVLDHQGKYKESMELYKRVYDSRLKILGPEHPHLLNTMNNMSYVLCCQGKYEESMELYKKVYEMKLRTLGPEHPHSFSTMSSMAMVLDRQGKYEESMELFKKVYELGLRILEPEHPNMLSTMNNMALVLNHQGRYEESLELYKKVYEIGFRILGPEHGNLLITMNNMAEVFDRQGKHEESMELYKKVYESGLRILGPEHPTLLSTMHNMARALANQQRATEAVDLMQQVVAKRVEILGTNHPDTICSRKYLLTLQSEEEQ